MNLPCVVSSLSFLGAGVVSGRTPLSVLWVVSTLNHLGYDWIWEFDATLAHTICFYSALTCPRVLNPLTAFYWFAFAYTGFVYEILKLSHLPGWRGDVWHASTHVVSSMGMIVHYKAEPKPVYWPGFLFLWALMKKMLCGRKKAPRDDTTR